MEQPTARILVAEDSALLRRVIGDVLREQGWTVLEATDGASALHMAQTEDPAVLLMAREMEGLDGLAVLDALRSDPHTEDMPVVFVTGHTDAADLALGLQRGAHDYVRKPVDPVELVARIGTALRLRALHDELARRNAELEQLARTDIAHRPGQPPPRRRRAARDDRLRPPPPPDAERGARRRRQLQVGQRPPRPRRRRRRPARDRRAARRRAARGGHRRALGRRGVPVAVARLARRGRRLRAPARGRRRAPDERPRAAGAAGDARRSAGRRGPATRPARR